MTADDAGPGAASQLRRAAWLLLAGQVLVIAATLLHTGGEANDHTTIFAAYAASANWTAVHLAQFAGMAVLLAGLYSFCLASAAAGDGLGRVGAGATVAAFALYGALQAVDGVALKHAVDAWAGAPAAEKAARFAAAEAVRWLEWGLRSYHDIALGCALLLAAACALRMHALPRLLAAPVGLSGIAFLAQGWIAGAEGFTPAQSAAIVAAWALNLVGAAWLVALAGRA